MTIGEKIGGFLSYFNPFDTSFTSCKEFKNLKGISKVITVVATAFGTLLCGVGAVAVFRLCVKKFSHGPVDPQQATRIINTFQAKVPTTVLPENLGKEHEPRNEMLGRLTEYLNAYQEVYGTAKDDGDCFFDAVRQQFIRENIAPKCTVKSLRHDIFEEIKLSLSAEKVAKAFSEHDSQVDYATYMSSLIFTADEIKVKIAEADRQNAEVDIELSAKMERRDQLTEELKALPKTGDNAEMIETLTDDLTQASEACDRLMKKRVAAPYPVWGSELREGKILSEKYKVNFEITTVEPNQEPRRYTVSHPKGAKYEKTIKLALYSPHFVPIFSKEIL